MSVVLGLLRLIVAAVVLALATLLILFTAWIPWRVRGVRLST